jgi:tetratricopeptide (TPR) repeat protein
MLPPIVSPLEIVAAMNRAASSGRWLIVLAVSRLSSECRLIEEAAWSHEPATKWIDANAVAIGVDAFENAELGLRLGVVAVPTAIAYWSRLEASRLVGFNSVPTFVAWLSTLDRKLRSLSQGQSRERGEIERRRSSAKTSLLERRYSDALEHYMWLWRNMAELEPKLSGVRVSFLVNELRSLVDAYPSATQALVELRDAAEASAVAAPDSVDLRIDVIVLNGLIGDDERTIAWFDSVRNDSGSSRLIDGCAWYLAKALKRRGRWSDVGRISQNPLAQLALHYTSVPGAIPPETRSGAAGAVTVLDAVAVKKFRQAAADILRSLQAAGKLKDADAVYREALRLDPSDEMRLALEGCSILYN